VFAVECQTGNPGPKSSSTSLVMVFVANIHCLEWKSSQLLVKNV